MMHSKLGISFRDDHDLTQIDRWFLKQIEELIHFEKEIEKYNIDSIPADLMEIARKKVMQIGRLLIY